MMKTVTCSSVAVSLGSFLEKRMIPSCDRRAPTTITRPSTSSALARIEPTIAVCATTSSPFCSAKIRTNSTGRLPSEACSIPVIAGPRCSPSCSVANETTHARPPSASVAMPKRGTAAHPP
jgi:hypothetical protein